MLILKAESIFQSLCATFYEALSKELTIKTSFINPNTTARAIHVLALGQIDIDKVLSTELTMEAWQEMRTHNTDYNSAKSRFVLLMQKHVNIKNTALLSPFRQQSGICI